MSRWWLALALVCPACLAATDEDDPVADAASAVHPGPCTTACYAVATGACDWSEQCGDGEWPPIAACEGLLLTCDEAEHAALATINGVEYCYRGCENFKN